MPPKSGLPPPSGLSSLDICLLAQIISTNATTASDVTLDLTPKVKALIQVSRPKTNITDYWAADGWGQIPVQGGDFREENLCISPQTPIRCYLGVSGLGARPTAQLITYVKCDRKL